MFSLWIIIKPLLIGLVPGLNSVWRLSKALVGDALPTLVAIAAVIGGVVLLLSWGTAPKQAPMVLISEVESQQRAAHVAALLAANRQLEGTLQARDARENALHTRIGELEAQQRKALEDATADSDTLFSNDSEWMRAKRSRAERR